MAKRIFILIFVFLLFLPISFSALSDNLDYCWSLDDSKGNNSVTANGNYFVKDTDGTPDVVPAQFSNGWDFELADEEHSDTAYTFPLTSDDTKSVCLWFKPESFSATQYIIHLGTTDCGANGNMNSIYIKTTKQMSFAGCSMDYDTGSYLVQDDWNFICFKFDGNAVSTYLNGSDTVLTDQTKSFQSVTGVLRICNSKHDVDQDWCDGIIDNVMVWSRDLSDAEFSELWDNGNGMSCDDLIGGGDTESPTINTTYPVHNTSIDGVTYPFWINGTVSDDTGISNLTVNMTGWTLDWNWTSETDTHIYFNFTRGSMTNGLYTLNITVNDTSGNENSSIVYFIVDTTLPVLTINSPANKTGYENSLSVDVSCTDTNVYRLNYTLSKGGVTVDTHENMTPIGNELSIIQTIDTSSYDSGDYYFNVTCSDSHTLNKIDYYNVDVIDKKITFNGIVSVNLISFDEKYLNKLEYMKLEDRYLIDYGIKVPYGTYIFELKSSYQIDYIRGSSYKAHFVTGKYWIDFENNDINAEYSIKKVNDKTYRITIKTDSLNFNSIGELNIVKKFHVISIDHINPETNLTYPANRSVFNNSGSIDFKCNSTHNVTYVNFVNLSLHTNLTGEWVVNSVYEYIGDIDEGYKKINKTFTVSASNSGHYEWYCEACDENGHCGVPVFNWSFNVNITGLEEIMNCTYNDEPFLKSKIPFIRTSGRIYWICSLTNDYKCNSLVLKEGDLLQNNPEPYNIEGYGEINSFSSIGNDDGYVKPYFMKKNLLPDEEFTFVVKCTNGTSEVNFNSTITPRYKPLYGVLYGTYFVKNNIGIIIVFIVLILGMIALYIKWKKG